METQAKSILLISDDVLLQELLALALASYGYAIHKAADLPQALELAQQTAPDLIVLDMLIPMLAGLKFLYELRHQRQQTTPVLVLTAGQAPDNGRALLEAGASLVAGKPIALEELAARVRACLATESTP